MTPEVDVLVPTRDRPVELATTLAGLAAQHDVSFRVLVSDQSDGPASFDTPAAATLLRVLALRGRPVHTTRHFPRRGLAEHRAALLAAARARYVLYLDDDVWLEPGALARLTTAIERLSCGFVGAAVQGLSYLHDIRPDGLEPFERWDGPRARSAFIPAARPGGATPCTTRPTPPTSPNATCAARAGSPTKWPGSAAACSTTAPSSSTRAGSTSGPSCRRSTSARTCSPNNG